MTANNIIRNIIAELNLALGFLDESPRYDVRPKLRSMIAALEPLLREEVDEAIFVSNLVNAARAAGFDRGRQIDDTDDNRAEDAAVERVLSRFAALRQQLAKSEEVRRVNESCLRNAMAEADDERERADTVEKQLTALKAAEVEGVVENDGKIYTRRESGTYVSHNPLPFPPGTPVLVRPADPPAVRRLAEEEGR